VSIPETTEKLHDGGGGRQLPTCMGMSRLQAEAGRGKDDYGGFSWFGRKSFMTNLSSLGWLQDRISTKAEDILIRVLSSGPIPKHVAFVMDGNRRYARMNHKQPIQGHTDGFLALRRVRTNLNTSVGFPKPVHHPDSSSMLET
jgi:Putative undecaprenyl diphosphate synthase